MSKPCAHSYQQSLKLTGCTVCVCVLASTYVNVSYHAPLTSSPPVSIGSTACPYLFVII